MSLFVLVALLAVLAIPSMAQDPVTVTWYVGVGTGGDPAQREAQEEVVQRFNDSRDDIQINLIIVENNVAVDTLATLIATGEGPDIVGPAGFAGANAFRGNWLGIDELVEADGYDMSQFPEAAVNVQRDDQGALLGLPLANFPTVIYYRPALFEEAGLEMLPENYGDMYMLDGEEVEWNVETLTEVAKILTVDENGNDATMEEFDPATTIQWGFTNQWSGNLRQHGTMFGAGSLYEVDADGNYVAVFPEQWREALKWEYAGIWEGQYIPDASEDGSDLLAAGNAFSSGNLAMAQSHLWYTCCLSDDEWELAPIPSALGQTTARLHADTFRILNTTENPEAAFEVLKYLTGEASLDLLAVYGGMPARPDDQPAFFEGMMEKFPSVTNWQVVGQSLEYTDVPSHEEWLPNNNKTNDRIDALWSLLSSTPDLDVDAEIDTLVSDLQAIYDEAAES